MEEEETEEKKRKGLRRKSDPHVMVMEGNRGKERCW
jgi:hypothetical protein